MCKRIRNAKFFAEEARNDLGAYVKLINDDVLPFLDGAIQHCGKFIVEQEQYRTPQWQQTALLTGYALVMGLLIGAALMAQ